MIQNLRLQVLSKLYLPYIIKGERRECKTIYILKPTCVKMHMNIWKEILKYQKDNRDCFYKEHK